MAILAECPACHRKQSIKHKLCKCGEDIKKAKDSKRVKYWIHYRLPGGKQKWVSVDSYDDCDGYSIEDARDVAGKVRTNKREKKLFDMPPDTEITFQELSEQYLDQEDIKGAASYRIIGQRLNKLYTAVGDKIVADIQPRDLTNYRARCEKEGLADSYIDDIIGVGKTVINWAFENRLVSSDTLRNFKAVKKTMSVGDNARDRVLTVQEFDEMHKHAAPHFKGVLLAGYWTGLRENDILGLTWDRIDLKNRIIHFTVSHRRRQKPKPREIYIIDPLYDFLKANSGPRKIDEDNHVFQYKGQHLKNISRALRTACKNAKIPYGRDVKNGFVFHDLRHGSVTDMRKAKVDPSVNRVWHGHSNGRTAHEGYHTFDREDLRKAGQSLLRYRTKQR
ncbi:MAG: tyrosine-type recombinase/integrase, partial [Deltaproteobacteria bacterium]|nr:tyrosine-type recombinase/integrase [Deltaproteobacteria bacterium]